MKALRRIAPLVLAALLVLPALAVPGGLTIEGVITAVSGNQVTLNGGIVVLDVTNAQILAHGDGGATGVAALVVGAPVLATVTKKNDDGTLAVSTLLVGVAEGIELRGALDAVDATAKTLKLLGLTVSVDAHTSFTGSTARGPVHSLADLQAGDTVDVEANRVSGQLVARHVHAETATPPSGTHPVTFIGKVETIGTDSWTISGKSVAVTATTEIEGSPAVGDMVKVKATQASDGTLTALSIEKMDRPAPSPLVRIHGTLEVKGTDSWTVSGTVVKIASTTQIKNDPKVGDQVEGLATKASDGTLTAIILVGKGTGGGHGGAPDLVRD